MPVSAQGHLGLRKEASFASGGTIDNWVPITSETLNKTLANVYSDEVRNSPEQAYGLAGLESVGGEIVFRVSPKGATQWLSCGLGQTTSPYYPTRPLSSLMIEIDHETSAVQASGCMVETITLSSASGAELSASMALQAKSMAKRTAGSPSYTANDSPYMHSDASFQLNGAADTSISAWSITIANNLVADLFGTGKSRIEIPAGKCSVTGTFTKLFDDVIERDAFLQELERSFWVKYAKGTNFLTVYCPVVRYDTHTENVSGQSEYIMEQFSFTAFSNDPATQNSIRISGDFS